MDFGLGSFLFAFLAGVLSILSPCVLPLIPIIIGAAANQHHDIFHNRAGFTAARCRRRTIVGVLANPMS